MHLSVYLYMCVRNAFAKCRCDWRWSWQCLRVVSAAFRLLSTWTELNWAAQVNRGWMWMWMSWTCRRIFYACMTYRDRFTLNFNNRCMSLAFANTARWRWNAGITFDSIRNELSLLQFSHWRYVAVPRWNDCTPKNHNHPQHFLVSSQSAPLTAPTQHY